MAEFYLFVLVFKAQKKSKLSNWFDLPRGDFSKENQEDLEIIAKRHVLVPALHTRKEDGRKSYFQVCYCFVVAERPTREPTYTNS